MTNRTLTRRIDALESHDASGSCIWIRMQPEESEEQAQARWLAENSDRTTELQCAQVHFIRRVFVDSPLATASRVGYTSSN
jgi:hypothetical protein